MTAEINELTELAYEGGAPLSTTPVVGTPSASPAALFTPSAESVRDGEIRVTVLGSGDPFVKHSQASASLLIEVGNPERDLFFFDLGSGALANYNGLGLPVTATTKVFLTHLQPYARPRFGRAGCVRTRHARAPHQLSTRPHEANRPRPSSRDWSMSRRHVPVIAPCQ